MESTETNIPANAQSALNRAVMLHLFDPNVSLIDLGWRIRDRQSQKVEPELCVRVHLRQKPYGKAFDDFAIRYPERVVDPDRIGFSIDVPKANYRTHQWSRQPAVPSNFRNRLSNPMRGGISISNALMSGYGTLGGKVIDRDTGTELILSNWHVLVGTWYAWSGLAIYQPGRGDGGKSYYTVAVLKDHAMDQMIDAAVAELTGARPLVNDQLDIGPVTGAGEPMLGMHVMKSGRRTGVTSGIITGIEGRQAMNYGGIPRVIRHVVHIAQTPEGGQVSDRGDSGSWWLDETTRRAVGLHFAGSNTSEYGLAIAMPQVLEALNIDIATDAEYPVAEPEQPLENELIRT